MSQPIQPLLDPGLAFGRTDSVGFQRPSSPLTTTTLNPSEQLRTVYSAQSSTPATFHRLQDSCKVFSTPFEDISQIRSIQSLIY